MFVTHLKKNVNKCKEVSLRLKKIIKKLLKPKNSNGKPK